MTAAAESLAAYDDWKAEREQIMEAESEGAETFGEGEDETEISEAIQFSDDLAIDLLHDMAITLRALVESGAA